MPTQYLLGIFMLYLSYTVNSLLQREEGPDIVTLTAVFFMLAFLAATQVGIINIKHRHTYSLGVHIKTHITFFSIRI